MRELDIKTKDFLDAMIEQSDLPPSTTHQEVLVIIKKEFDIRKKLIDAINKKLYVMGCHFDKDFVGIREVDELDRWTESILLCSSNDVFNLIQFQEILDLKAHHLLCCSLRVEFGKIYLDFKVSKDKLNMLREYI